MPDIQIHDISICSYTDADIHAAAARAEVSEEQVRAYLTGEPDIDRRIYDALYYVSGMYPLRRPAALQRLEEFVDALADPESIEFPRDLRELAEQAVEASEQTERALEAGGPEAVDAWAERLGRDIAMEAEDE